MAYACKHTTREAEAEKYLSLSPAWAIYTVSPCLKTLNQPTNQQFCLFLSKKNPPACQVLWPMPLILALERQEFQGSQGYAERLCFKNNNNNKKILKKQASQAPSPGLTMSPSLQPAHIILCPSAFSSQTLLLLKSLHVYRPSIQDFLCFLSYPLTVNTYFTYSKSLSTQRPQMKCAF